MNSRFRGATDVWLRKIAEKHVDSTPIYTHRLNKLVPPLGELRLAECDVARRGALLSRVAEM